MASKVLFQIFSQPALLKLSCSFLAQLVAFSEVLPVCGGLQNGSCPSSQAPGLRLHRSVAWLEISFQVLTLIEIQKYVTRRPVAWSTLWVRFNNTSFPLCRLRRWESQGAWNSGNGGVLSCFLLPKNCSRASLLPRCPEGLSGHSHAIVEYPYLCTRKMKGLGVSDWWDG